MSTAIKLSNISDHADEQRHEARI